MADIDWSKPLPKDGEIDWSKPLPKEVAAPAAASTPAISPVTAKPAEPDRSAVSQALTFAQETGRGVTAGAIKYPAAALMKVFDQAVGDGKMTWADAFDALKGQHTENMKDRPGAAIAGNILGGGTLAYLSGGTSLPGMVASNAVQGAVSGFTEDEKLSDAALGAGTGAVLGAAGKVVGNLAGAAGESIARSNIVGKVRDLISKEDFSALKGIFGEGTPAQLMERAKTYALSMEKGKMSVDQVTREPIEAMYAGIKELPVNGRTMKAMDDLAKKNGFKDYHEFSSQNQGIGKPLTRPVELPLRPRDFSNQSGVPVADVFAKSSANDYWKLAASTMTDTAKNTLYGFGLGGMGQVAMGDKSPIDPIKAAGIGAAYGASKALAGKAARDMITKAVVNESNPISSGVVSSAATQALVPPVVRSRLGALADDFKRKFNPQIQQEPGYYDIPAEQQTY